MLKACLLIVTLGTAFAQESAPITEEYLQDLRKEVVRARKAAEKAVRVEEDAARAAEKQGKGIKEAVSENSEALKTSTTKIEKAIDKQQEKIIADQTQGRRTFFIVSLSLGLLAVAGLIVFLLRREKSVKAEAEEYFDTEFRARTRLVPMRQRNLPRTNALTRRMEETARNPIIVGLPENPRPKEIEEYAKKHNIFDVHFNFDGSCVRARVNKISGDILSVSFPGHPEITPCGVDRAYKTAMRCLASANQPADQQLRN